MSMAVATGERLRDLILRDADGREVMYSDWRGRRNLVVLAGPVPQELVAGLASAAEVLREEETQVLQVSLDAGHLESDSDSIKRLFDPDMRAHRDLGALHDVPDRAGTVQDSRPHPAVVVTDRYGEIRAEFRGNDIPEVAEIVNWLRYINSECPE